MSKKLVAYFCASGVAAKVAESLSKASGADIYAIKPKVPCTKDNMNWVSKSSRSSVEMKEPNSHPEITEQHDNMDEYEVVFVGSPIWRYVAPAVINTFLKGYDLSRKTIIPFATARGS